MTVLRSRSFGSLALRLCNLGSLRGRTRRAGGGVRALPINAVTRATQEAVVELLTRAMRLDDPTARVGRVGAAANGTVSVEGGSLRYRSRRLFVGRERIEFELIDGAGMRRGATVTIEVAPHPEIGAPFEDGSFFADETGFAVES